MNQSVDRATSVRRESIHSKSRPWDSPSPLRGWRQGTSSDIDKFAWCSWELCRRAKAFAIRSKFLELLFRWDPHPADPDRVDRSGVLNVVEGVCRQHHEVCQLSFFECADLLANVN